MCLFTHGPRLLHRGLQKAARIQLGHWDGLVRLDTGLEFHRLPFALGSIIITFVNPGTVILVACMIWSMLVTKFTNSIRLGALAMFCCFLVGFVILTYFATVHRGPNWDFFWSQSDWPVH